MSADDFITHLPVTAHRLTDDDLGFRASRPKVHTMPETDADTMAGAVKDAIKYALRHALPPLTKRIEALEQKNAALEKQIAELQMAKWVGVWNESTEYKAGNFVTWDGSIWHADIDSRGVRPGPTTGGKIWTLAGKRGRDGRDAR
jgi:hypothetical protein